jgi:hypothetical protein
MGVLGYQLRRGDMLSHHQLNKYEKVVKQAPNVTIRWGRTINESEIKKVGLNLTTTVSVKEAV